MSKHQDDLSIRESKSRQKPDIPMQPKASYTDEAFYKKMNAYKNMPTSYVSPKQSIYQQIGHPSSLSLGGEVDFNTLNPSKNYYKDSHEEEYEIVVEFELKREREKNKILEERLRNKEVFISQMKQVQDQLSSAFQKCQEDLHYYRSFYESQGAADVREYLEEISDLKHLLIRMEDEIQYLKKSQNKHFSSVKDEILIEDQNEHPSKNASNRRAAAAKSSKRSNIIGDKTIQQPAFPQKQKRSKTMMNNQQSSPEFKKFSAIEEYIIKYSSRISNFITQFLAMVQCFSEEAIEAKKDKSTSNIKCRLKIGWKWIKQVVIEWNNLKNIICKYEKFMKALKKMSRISQGSGLTLQECFQKILECFKRS